MSGERKTRDRLVVAVAVVLLALAGVWVATRPAASRADAQAEHDMGGITVGGEGSVSLAPEVAHSLGITTVTVELGPVSHSLRTTGHVVWDETRLTTIAPKFGGFVERLYVDNTGQAVRRGQPVLEIYSPDLVAAQEELLTALRLERQLAGSAAPGVAEGSGRLADAARRKLLLWDISPAQIERIERTGEVRRTLTLHAGTSGFVVDKLVQAGQAVEPGMPLYRLADLSSVWVEADVYEQDLRFVRTGDRVRVEIAAYPGETLTGVVAYIYPDMQVETRTARVRVVLPNSDGRVKPGMFATVLLSGAVTERAVLAPRDAVMRTGTRDLVFVETAPGMYEPREVRTGAETDGKVQILSGLLAGERVVARANFLLDAESRLMESMGGATDLPGTDHVH